MFSNSDITKWKEYRQLNNRLFLVLKFFDGYLVDPFMLLSQHKLNNLELGGRFYFMGTSNLCGLVYCSAKGTKS